MTPIEVVRAWFAAHAAGDLDAARALLADDAPMEMPDATVRGFDAFMTWYEARRASEGASFGYEVVDVLGGERHAAAVLRMTAAGATWRQVAVYEVEDGRIARLTAYEDDR
jgi:ketosteroid isomerase-like protein